MEKTQASILLERIINKGELMGKAAKMYAGKSGKKSLVAGYFCNVF